MNITEIRNSGLLEGYLLQNLSNEDYELVSGYILKFPELKNELAGIESALESYAMAGAIAPPLTIKPMLLSTIEFVERLEKGEIQEPVPSLSDDTKIVEFDKWLNRSDLQEAEHYESMFAHIIGKDDEKSTAIVWLKHGAPPETHTHEIEKFFILEGTCDITIDQTVYSLKAGDFLEVPLYVTHHVKVTSSKRCKLILERAVA